MLKYAMLIEYLNNNPLLGTLLIISIGYFLGNLKIRGISFGSSAILFVGIYAGLKGVHLPPILKILGLSFFIYSIGLQAGPKLRSMFNSENLKLEFAAFLIVMFGAVLTIFSVVALNLDKNIAIGIFAGALTSTPGLAAAYEATGSNLTSIGYGVAYPFGVIGVILFLKIVQLIYSEKIRESEEVEKKEEALKKSSITYKQILVKNPSVLKKPLKDLKIIESFNCVVSRVIKNERVIIPTKDTYFDKGDVVRVVGALENIERVAIFLGELIEYDIPESDLTVMRFVITNKKIIGKTIRELRLKCSFNANITRITRAGFDIPARGDLKFEWGDRVTVVGEKNSKDYFRTLFGDDVKKVNEANVFSIILGLTLGILIGMVPVSFGSVFSFKLGITGGVLISSLLLSNIGKLGPVLWRAPSNIITFIRELGLIFFLTSVGCSAGDKIVDVLKAQGIGILLWGAVITLLPMALVFYLSLVFFKIDIVKVLGLIPAGMTSTPGFAIATSITESETPSTIYATVYPIAMLSMIIFAKILAVVL